MLHGWLHERAELDDWTLEPELSRLTAGRMAGWMMVADDVAMVVNDEDMSSGMMLSVVAWMEGCLSLGCVGNIGDESWRLELGELLKDCCDVGSFVVLMKKKLLTLRRQMSALYIRIESTDQRNLDNRLLLMLLRAISRVSSQTLALTQKATWTVSRPRL